MYSKRLNLKDIRCAMLAYSRLSCHKFYIGYSSRRCNVILHVNDFLEGTFIDNSPYFSKPFEMRSVVQ